ncbi:crustacean hyperglycemic hormone isoform X1 [Dermacentor andersoni]|uniref:Prepro ion transport-like peptide n=1 Tax=Dermacentor variabilis TaxID=34621 RepID=B2Z9X0_DERVA|nr:crustacean hyperglycemic hormone-like [Dermacentor andersoni]XP_050041814.1 crustacean hyperglycemic hormone-like [Dermacentor andersoni]ACC99599.1 prepro ion transport-like peptide [Dermacentor variabilis]
MSASFPVVPARWLAAALLVCSLVALTQPGGCAARNLHKRSFLELGCRGNFEQSYLARLERVCEECYQLYREPEVYNLCRDNCFKNENFLKCAEALLLKEEMDSLKSKVDYLYSR